MTNWSRLYLATSWKSTCKTSAVSVQRLYIAVLYTVSYQHVECSSSRSSKVIDFAANQKRTCNVLLVISHY